MSVELPEEATVRHALDTYAEKYRSVGNMRGVVILKNKSVAWYEDKLEDGDEITVLRAYAGG